MSIRIWITASLIALSAAAGAKNKPQTRLVGDTPAQTRQIWKKGFFGDQTLVSVTVPEGIDTIQSCTFEDCKNLRTVRLPGTIKYIDSHAFSGCSSLDSIIFPSDEALRKARNEWPNEYGSISNLAFEGCDGPLSAFVNVREPYVVSFGCLYHLYSRGYYMYPIAPLTFRSSLSPKYLYYNFMYYYVRHKGLVITLGTILAIVVICLLLNIFVWRPRAKKRRKEQEIRWEQMRKDGERRRRDMFAELVASVDADPAECEIQFIPHLFRMRNFVFVAWDKRKIIINDTTNSFDEIDYISFDNDCKITEREVGGTDPFLAAMYMFIGAATHGPAGSTAGYAAAKWSGEANKKIETTTKNDYIVSVHTLTTPPDGIQFRFGEDKAAADKLYKLLWNVRMKGSHAL